MTSSKLDDVQVIDRRMIRDERGWFLKLVSGAESKIGEHLGEVYATLALPGQSRGGHYHRVAAEWFTVLSGAVELDLACTETGERRSLSLAIEAPCTVYVPPGVAHVFRNRSADQPATIVAYSDRRFDPADTVPYAFEGTRDDVRLA